MSTTKVSSCWWRWHYHLLHPSCIQMDCDPINSHASLLNSDVEHSSFSPYSSRSLLPHFLFSSQSPPFVFFFGLSLCISIELAWILSLVGSLVDYSVSSSMDSWVGYFFNSFVNSLVDSLVGFSVYSLVDFLINSWAVLLSILWLILWLTLWSILWLILQSHLWQFLWWCFVGYSVLCPCCSRFSLVLFWKFLTTSWIGDYCRPMTPRRRK